MNIYLLVSSIICGLIISIIINTKYNLRFSNLYKLVILGIITSILNHGTSNLYFKYLDRLIIIINILYIYYIINCNNKNKNNCNFNMINSVLFAGCSFFLVSKIPSIRHIKITLHMCSHIMAVILLYIIHK